MLILINKPKYYSSSVSIIKLLFYSSLFILCSLEKRHHIQPYLGVGRCVPAPGGQSTYINNLEFFMGVLSVLLNLFVSVWPCGYLFYNFIGEYEMHKF